jgi:ubiquinone/menaquinone biosynthesis C-methylase UbiE
VTQWIVTLIVAVWLIGMILWWLFIRTEGVYLGKSIVIWLYDIYARRYDRIVQHDTVEEHLHLAAPLMQQIDPHTHPLVLDVATGTGRILLALCHHIHFEGHIVALDLSRGMLQEASRKISAEHFEDFVTFLWSDGSQLPFEDNQFDIVTCMESLEFMPQPDLALRELIRVLRPGGILLTTQRINENLMPGKLWSEAQMHTMLAHNSIEQIDFEAWQYDYTKVWGIKKGTSDFIGAMPLDGLIRCPCCNSPMQPTNGSWRCVQCHATAPIADDNIIELQKISCENRN